MFAALRFLPLPALVAAGVAAASPTAVEFYHAGYGHYFVTAAPAEIAAIDASEVPGWVRTGETFPVLDLSTSGENVCRFWSGQSFAPRSSHFYTPDAAECATVKRNPDWKFEGQVYAIKRPEADGGCLVGTQALYRLYNNGQGGAPNHRYTVSPAVRAMMIGKGWTPEGAGIGVIGCVPAPAGSYLQIVAAGDIANCTATPATESGAARTAALVKPEDSLVLTLGDNAYEDGSPEQFATCFDPTWGRFRERLRPAPGNHEYKTPDAAGYFDYFGPLAGPDRRGYYSFDAGGWHFVSINTMIAKDETSAQYRWMQADLAASKAACTIVYWHFPRYNSGTEHGSYESMRPMFQLAYDAGVDLALAGDEHIYERFAPQNAVGVADPARGVRQFTVGTGGALRYALGPRLPNSEFATDEHWGVLRLTLGSGEYSWQFVSADGGVLDSGTGNCHR